jgi:hypothetical protein
MESGDIYTKVEVNAMADQESKANRGARPRSKSGQVGKQRRPKVKAKAKVRGGVKTINERSKPREQDRVKVQGARSWSKIIASGKVRGQGQGNKGKENKQDQRPL